jgi:hypothetical protein
MSLVTNDTFAVPLPRIFASSLATRHNDFKKVQNPENEPVHARIIASPFSARAKSINGCGTDLFPDQTDAFNFPFDGSDHASHLLRDLGIALSVHSPECDLAEGRVAERVEQLLELLLDDGC